MLTNEVVDERVLIEDMKVIPKPVLAEINKDYKRKFDMTYGEIMTVE